ncbi:hypothetical protein BJV74DRAFT_796658 [Russula compacta]|nr:hypothetical protein BJV74DRAFT_796658 [Russula compacta]
MTLSREVTTLQAPSLRLSGLKILAGVAHGEENKNWAWATSRRRWCHGCKWWLQGKPRHEETWQSRKKRTCRAAIGGGKEGQGPNQKVRSTKTDATAAAGAVEDSRHLRGRNGTAMEGVDLEPYDSGANRMADLQTKIPNGTLSMKGIAAAASYLERAGHHVDFTQ